MKFIYVNLGDHVSYTYDKILGRVSTWAALGHEITIMVPEISRDALEREISEHALQDIEVVCLPGTNWSATNPLKVFFSYLHRLLVTPSYVLRSRQNYDVAISNSAFMVDTFLPICLKLVGKCKHWMLIMDSVVPPPKSRQGLFIVNLLTYLESILVGRVANIFAVCIFTVNIELKKQLVSRGIDKSKIKLTQNGLFVRSIHDVSRLGNFKCDAVYQGRISPNKGVYDLLDAWSGVVKELPLATLVVMGSGLKENVSSFQKRINKLKLKNNVIFLGFTNKPKKYEIMKSSRIFLYLSKVNADESWGISLMEALACGLPAISYDLPIYKHIYKTDSLLRVPLGDTTMVKREIVELLKNHKRRKILSDLSTSFSQEYSWDAIATRDLKIINDTIKSKTKT